MNETKPLGVGGIIKKAGFVLDHSLIVLTTPSGRTEILTIDELMELICFIQKHPNSIGILIEQSWRNRKKKVTA